MLLWETWRSYEVCLPYTYTIWPKYRLHAIVTFTCSLKRLGELSPVPAPWGLQDSVCVTQSWPGVSGTVPAPEHLGTTGFGYIRTRDCSGCVCLLSQCTLSLIHSQINLPGWHLLCHLPNGFSGEVTQVQGQEQES